MQPNALLETADSGLPDVRKCNLITEFLNIYALLFGNRLSKLDARELSLN